MTTLAEWIGYGHPADYYRKQAIVRRMIRDHRNHSPIIDRVNFPDRGARVIVCNATQQSGNRQAEF